MVLYQNTKEDDERFWKTQNRDIKLNNECNGRWDLTLDHDDYTISKGLTSLYNACVIACLTGYNEIGDRYKNETYSEFGNHAYELLKKNKTRLVEYKMEEYFTQALKNIRRVSKVNEVVVTESNNPNTYDVFFNVTGLDDETAYGTVTLTDTSSNKISTQCNLNITHTVKSENKKPYLIRGLNGNVLVVKLKDQRNRVLSKQLVKIYSGETLIGVGLTDNNGQLMVNYTPTSSSRADELYAQYNGNIDYEKCVSNSLNLLYCLFSVDIYNNTLRYSYDTDNYHPDLSINSEGKLVMTYDTDYMDNPQIFNKKLYVELK